MSQPSSLEHLKPGDWERLRAAAEQLEQAWRDHVDIDLAFFLPSAADPLHGPILEELVKTDLEIRRSRGQAVSLDYYLEKYPHLGDAPTLPARLIYEEYRVLRRFGEPVDLEHYRQRFPKQFEELQRLVSEQSVYAEGETHRDSSPPGSRPPSATILKDGDVLTVGEGYRLIKCIGSGSFGEVWEVEAPGGFPAAMKIIRRTLGSEEAKRELRALEVIKRLSHPHLLKTTASWALQDRLIILMELADCTLRDRLRVCKAGGASGIPVAELLRYFQEAAEALDYLHVQKVLHRDVKPQNLLLCHGHVKVADFGLVRDQKLQHASDSLSGTPGYMAPEAWGCAPCAASDQYSLALTYAELRLGRWPFASNDAPILAHLEGTPDLTRLGAAERDVLLRGLAKSPKERFPTCQCLVSALREALPGAPAQYDLRAASPPCPIPAPQPVSRSETTDGRPPRERESKPPQTQPADKFETQGEPLEPTSETRATLAPVKQRVRGDPSETSDHAAPLPIPRAKQRKAGQSWRWVRRIAVVLLLLLVSGLVIRLAFFMPSFKLLEPPEGVILSAGTGKSVSIGIERRHGFRKGVNLEVSIVGNGLSVVTSDIAPDSDNSEARVDVSADATPGLRRVDVHATANGEQKQTTSLQVVVLPPGFKAFEEPPPPDWRDMPYPSKIIRHVGEQQVVFVLIRPQGEADAPFYLMETKVRNRVFRAFAGEHPDRVIGLDWKRGGVADGRDVGDADELPVFRVNRPEAERCAHWLKGLLPTAQQLDRAFGYDDWRNGRRDLPAPKAAAVNRIQRGPRKITESDDLSPYGIRDLAGNGREWTRDDLISTDGKLLTVLRGRSYTDPEPLSFAKLDEWNKNPENCPVLLPDRRSWTTSFRVVIELPVFRRASD